MPTKRTLVLAAASCSALASLPAAADVTLRALEVWTDPVRSGPMIDNQGRIAISLLNQDYLLTPSTAYAGGYAPALIKLPSTAGIVNGEVRLTGLSLDSGQWLAQVVQSDSTGTRPLDAYIGSVGGSSWTSIAGLAPGQESLVRSMFATGLADDGRVLLQAPAANWNRSFGGALLGGGTLQPLQPVGYQPPRVLVNGQRVIAGVSELHDLPAPGDPWTPTRVLRTLPDGGTASAINSFGGVVGGSFLGVPGIPNTAEGYASFDVNTLLATGTTARVASLSGLNDRGQLVGTATSGRPLLLQAQGTRDYLGSGRGWSSPFVTALLAREETDYRITGLRDDGTPGTPGPSWRDLALDGVTVGSLRIGGSRDGSEVYFTMNGGSLRTTRDLVLARGELILGGPATLAAGRDLVVSDELTVRADSEVRTGRSFRLDGWLGMQGGRLQVSTDGQPNLRGTIAGSGGVILYGGQLDADLRVNALRMPATGLVSQGRVEGNVVLSRAFGGSGAIVLGTTQGSQLAIGGALRITGPTGTLHLYGADDPVPELRGSQLVVGALDGQGRYVGDAVANAVVAEATAVTVDAGSVLHAGSFLLRSLPKQSATPAVLRVDGTLDTWGGAVTVESGVLAGNGTINGASFEAVVVAGGTDKAWVRPGSSPGHLVLGGAFVLGANGVLELEVERGADGRLAWDRLDAASMSFLGGSELRLIVGSGVQAADLAGLALLGCGSGCSLAPGAALVVDGIDGLTLALDAQGLHLLPAVPEPSRAWLMAAGLLAIGRIAATRRGRGAARAGSHASSSDSVATAFHSCTFGSGASAA